VTDYDRWKLAEPPTTPHADKLEDAHTALDAAWDRFALAVAYAENVRKFSPWSHRREVIGTLDSLPDIVSRCRQLDTRHNSDEPDWCRAQLVTLIECMNWESPSQIDRARRVQKAYRALVDAEEALSDLEREERP
jgi:hypothetical protein